MFRIRAAKEYTRKKACTFFRVCAAESGMYGLGHGITSRGCSGKRNLHFLSAQMPMCFQAAPAWRGVTSRGLSPWGVPPSTSATFFAVLIYSFFENCGPTALTLLPEDFPSIQVYFSRSALRSLIAADSPCPIIPSTVDWCTVISASSFMASGLTHWWVIHFRNVPTQTPPV